jgi:hypothetical protein
VELDDQLADYDQCRDEVRAVYPTIANSRSGRGAVRGDACLARMCMAAGSGVQHVVRSGMNEREQTCSGEMVGRLRVDRS